MFYENFMEVTSRNPSINDFPQGVTIITILQVCLQQNKTKWSPPQNKEKMGGYRIQIHMSIKSFAAYIFSQNCVIIYITVLWNMLDIYYSSDRSLLQEKNIQ